MGVRPYFSGPLLGAVQLFFLGALHVPKIERKREANSTWRRATSFTGTISSRYFGWISTWWTLRICHEGSGVVKVCTPATTRTSLELPSLKEKLGNDLFCRDDGMYNLGGR